MKQTISILGCGWLGKSLAIKLVKNGFEVNGSSTTASKLKELEAEGISPFQIDINKLNHSISDFLQTDVLIIAITSKNLEDYSNLITEIEKTKLRKVLFVSSTSVYPSINGIVTEESPLQPSALAEIETLFRNNKQLESTILRFGGLFGYSREPGNFFKDNKQIDHPEGHVNLIHQDDCIQIIKKIIDKDCWNCTLNACADSHPTRRDFYSKQLKKQGVNNPNFSEDAANSYKIVSSEKLKRALDYEFIHADLMIY